MGIQINSGFDLGSANYLDSRQYLSFEEMKNINENIYPDKYFVMGKDDGKIYIYNKNNEVSEDTGKFKVLESGLDTLIQVESLPSAEENIEKIYQFIGTSNAMYKNGYWYIAKEIKPIIYKVIAVLANTTYQADLDAVRITEEEKNAIDSGINKIVTSTDGLYKLSISSIDVTLTELASSTVEETVPAVFEDSGEGVSTFAWKQINVQPKLSIDAAATPTEGYLKTYVFKLDEEEIGNIDIPKDLVVTSGKITKISIKDKETSEEPDIFIIDGDETKTYTADDVINKESAYYCFPIEAGVFVQLGIANQTFPIFVNVKDIARIDFATEEEIIDIFN